MSNRIKLAEAMGWRSEERPLPWDDSEVGTYTVWFNPNNITYGGNSIPDPETDANDDYNVLEYFRNRALADPKQWQKFKDYFIEERSDWNIWNYSIGLFARAALKVLE